MLHMEHPRIGSRSLIVYVPCTKLTKLDSSILMISMRMSMNTMRYTLFKNSTHLNTNLSDHLIRSKLFFLSGLTSYVFLSVHTVSGINLLLLRNNAFSAHTLKIIHFKKDVCSPKQGFEVRCTEINQTSKFVYRISLYSEQGLVG